MKDNKLMKTNIVIAFILLVGFMMTAFFGYKANYQSSLDNIEHVSSLTSDGIYYQLNTMFSKPVNISLTMAHDSFLKRHLGNEENHLEDAQYTEALKEYLNAYKKKYGFDSVFLVSSQSGRYYSYTGYDRIINKTSVENAWYYDLLYSKEEYSLNVDNDEVEGASNEITVFVNCKITDDKHNIMGIVGVGIRLDHLKELFAKYEEKYNIKAYLLNKEGNIEISTTYNGYEEINWFDRFKQQDLKKKILSWKGEIDNLEIWSNKANQKNFIVTRYVPELSWHLVVLQDTQHIMEAMHYQILKIVLMMIGMTISVLTIITIVIRNFNKQISILIEEKEAIFRQATEELYDNINELNITKNSYVGERTEKYFESLGAKGLPYDEGLVMIAEKQIKEEYRDGYINLFKPSNVIKEYESGNNHLQYDFMITENDKDYFWVRIDAYIFLSEEDNCLHMFTYRKNINDQKQREKQASLDDLTGFYNRKACVKKISDSLKRSSEDKHAFIIFDVDNFKQANDLYGHVFGDYCLQQFTQTIRKHFYEGDVLGRVGGDEFVVLCTYETYDMLIRRLKRLSQDLQRQCKKGHASWHMSASIGVSLYPLDGSDFASLYDYADQALYETKARGKNGYTLYHEIK